MLITAIQKSECTCYIICLALYGKTYTLIHSISNHFLRPVTRTSDNVTTPENKQYRRKLLRGHWLTNNVNQPYQIKIKPSSEEVGSKHWWGRQKSSLDLDGAVLQAQHACWTSSKRFVWPVTYYNIKIAK